MCAAIAGVQGCESPFSPFGPKRSHRPSEAEAAHREEVEGVGMGPGLLAVAGDGLQVLAHKSASLSNAVAHGDVWWRTETAFS
jgi:hypothetical protein